MRYFLDSAGEQGGTDLRVLVLPSLDSIDKAGKPSWRVDKPSPLQSAYVEPDVLAPPASYRGTTVLGELPAAGRPRSNLRPLPRGTLCFGTDVLMLAGAMAIALISAPVADRTGFLAWSGALAGACLLLFALRAYSARFHVRLLDDLARVVAATATAAMAVISLRLLLDAGDITETARYWLLATAAVAIGRTGLIGAEVRARRHGDAVRATLIVGAGAVGRLTAKRLMDRPELGLRPVGFLDKEPIEAGGALPVLPVLGASWDLEEVIKEHEIGHVIVAFSSAPHHVLLGIVRSCRERGVGVSVVPRLFEVEGDRVSVDRLGALPLVTMRSANPAGRGFRVKYAVERIIAALALLLTLPVSLAAMLAIRLTMGAPILFRQLRVGSDGREFYMLKLRTMKGTPENDGEADIDWAIEQLTATGAPVALGERRKGAQALETDRRTVLGRTLRRFSLDELPQLWNVVRGDMAIVGPRPERVSYARTFERSIYRYGERHRVKSGITGWAQVNGLRGRTSLSDRIEWDNYYIENWSPWLDLRIVLMTVACVLRGQHEEERQ
jgi:exopolysaccharide biosynthesis polyprenyl glycosylphosphotransferase